MIKQFFIIILLGSLALLFSCQQQENISAQLFPNPPDTSSFGKFANKLTANEKAWLIADTTYTREGKLRKIGIQEVPQNKDDFRNFGFDGGLLNKKYIRDADFRGAYFRSAKAIHSDFSYSDFTGGGLEGASFINSRLLACNFQGAHLQGVDFTGADLKDCYFFGAEFENTIFKDAINIPKIIQKMIVDNRITGLCDER